MAQATPTLPPGISLRGSPRRQRRERTVRVVFLAAALTTILISVFIIETVLVEALDFLSQIDLSQIPTDKVGLGSRVVVEDQQTRTHETYSLVFGDSVEFEDGHVSMGSPIGKALVGKGVGDDIVLKLPAVTRRLRIVELTTVAPDSMTTRPSSCELSSTEPCTLGSRIASTSRLQSRRLSFLPVSIHQPSSTSWRTR